MSSGYTSGKLDAFFRGLLDIGKFETADDSLNGLQVDNDGSEIKKIAFAVDASLECFKRAAEVKAGMIFVHHGLFWGTSLRIQGCLRERLKTLFDNNIAFYGVHLPLDQHPQLGNNAVLAGLLGIESPEPFGMYHGHKIGYKGVLAKPVTIDEAAGRVSFMGRPPLGVYPFGREMIRSAAIVSGGAADNVLEAVAEGLDLYITGETSHSYYHHALESKINLIAGGHYQTEVWGVRKIMEAAAAQLNIETEFLDIPTGL